MLAKFNQVVAFLIITSLIRFVTLMLQAYCGKVNVIKNIYQNVFLTHLNDYSVNFQRSKLFFNIFYKKKTNVNFFQRVLQYLRSQCTQFILHFATFFCEIECLVKRILILKTQRKSKMQQNQVVVVEIIFADVVTKSLFPLRMHKYFMKIINQRFCSAHSMLLYHK